MALGTFFCLTQMMPEEQGVQAQQGNGVTISAESAQNVNVSKHYFRGMSEFVMKTKDGELPVVAAEWTLDSNDCYLYYDMETAKRHLIELEMQDDMINIEPIQVEEDLVYPKPKD